MIARNRYDPATMKLSVWQKDMALIAGFAKTIGSPTPLFDATAPSTTVRWPTGAARRIPPRSRPCWNKWPV